jgi:hypothetical protein
MRFFTDEGADLAPLRGALVYSFELTRDFAQRQVWVR